MKCPNCGGTGVIHFRNIHVLCGKCKGIGFIDDDEPKPKKQMTEQEYIQTCTTEQLADVLMKIFATRTFCHLCPEGDVCDIGYKCKYSEGKKIEDWVEWLKEKYREG